MHRVVAHVTNGSSSEDEPAAASVKVMSPVATSTQSLSGTDAAEATNDRYGSDASLHDSYKAAFDGCPPAGKGGGHHSNGSFSATKTSVQQYAAPRVGARDAMPTRSPLEGDSAEKAAEQAPLLRWVDPTMPWLPVPLCLTWGVNRLGGDAHTNLNPVHVDSDPWQVAAGGLRDTWGLGSGSLGEGGFGEEQVVGKVLDKEGRERLNRRAGWMEQLPNWVSGAAGVFVPPLSAGWSDYYCTNPRMPDNTEVAPWVAVRRSKRVKV